MKHTARAAHDTVTEQWFLLFRLHLFREATAKRYKRLCN